MEGIVAAKPRCTTKAESIMQRIVGGNKIKAGQETHRAAKQAENPTTLSFPSFRRQLNYNRKKAAKWRQQNLHRYKQNAAKQAANPTTSFLRHPPPPPNRRRNENPS